ncbi:MAG TPA: hypothetical protein VKV39_17840 [Candidatus Sulfotelmatobacter sp.]|nr:hypothetical protein [Candidatus Sulfotelmatobacter sp.]
MRIRSRFLGFFAAGILLCVAPSASAQGPSPVVVVQATRHAIAPPLSQVASVPSRPAAEDDDRAPLRRHFSSRTGEDAASQNAHDFAPLAILAPLTTNGSLNFLGVGYGFPGFTVQSSVPDTNGAVGETQFVQFVNDSYAVFDKSTGAIVSGPKTGNTLWSSLGSPCSTSPHLDEVAQYDKLDKRWVMMMPSTSSLCIAVSQTSDAVTGGWNLYSFPIPSSANCGGGPCAADYPKLAVWPDAYYVSFNESKTTGGSTVFEGDAVCALDSASMMQGIAASKMQCFVDQSTSYGDILPADLDGTTAPPSGEPAYFLNFDSNDSSLDLWQFHVDWNTTSNTTFTGPTNIPVNAFTEPCGETGLEITYSTGHCIPQTGTPNTLDSYGDRLMYRVAYRNFPGTNTIPAHESIVANHTVDASGATGIRWYELQNPLPSSTPSFTVAQQGTYSPDSNYRWAGSIAMDQAGDIALGYSVSSSAMSPTIRYTGRLATDPVDTMESEIDVLQTANPAVTAGSLTGTNFHWADYSSMAVDPTDDCTFWFTTEYVSPSGTNWSTRIASFSFPSCGTTPDFSVSPSQPSETVSAGSPATFTVAVAAIGGFSNAVDLTCTAPTGVGIACSFNPTSVSPGTNSTLTVTTTARTAAQALPPGAMRSRTLLAACLGFPGLALVGIGSMGTRSRRRWMACLLLCAALSGAVVLQTACGGSGGTSSGGGGGTPAGTYTVNIGATSGSLQHPSTVSVIVQ